MLAQQQTIQNERIFFETCSYLTTLFHDPATQLAILLPRLRHVAVALYQKATVSAMMISEVFEVAVSASADILLTCTRR